MGRRHLNPDTQAIIDAASAAIRNPHGNWSSAQSFLGDDHAMKAIGALFYSLRAQPSDEFIRGCAHAVYGWMPTMLRYVDVDEAKRVMTNGLTASTTAFVNCSWVGTSKFLYFLDPNKFVIWDSRVGRALTLQNCDLRVRSAGDYQSYCDAIHEVAKDTALRDDMHPNLLRCGYSPARLVEVALYVLGNPHQKRRTH